MSRRFTLLIIPEDGGKTREFKLSSAAVWLCLAAMGTLGAAVIIALKFSGSARHLEEKVARLENEKTHLEEKVGKVEELERVLAEIQRRNQQLHLMLGGGKSASETGSPAASPPAAPRSGKGGE